MINILKTFDILHLICLQATANEMLRLKCAI